MSLPAGARLGPYEVIEPIGKGGMGEVYRARDTSLNRDVALKVLPELFAADAERLGRFEREAQALAALNHPNIAQVYAVAEGRAIVLELVEGEDLAQRLARGPLPVDEALPIARQIALALEAAHDAGIIHRDLKPANLKVRPDGTVKVLDFGLAKSFAADPATSASALANSPTLMARATELGVVLGTAAYMAPEQAKGRGVDRRADVWAFGVVLYEMLTGRRAFGGDDVTEVMAAVLRDTPDRAAVRTTGGGPCVTHDARREDRADAARGVWHTPLGVPYYNWSAEGLHGIVNEGGFATVFPQAIGMAATWDQDLIRDVASAMGDEARAKHHEAIRRKGYSEMYQGLTFWSPSINIFRDPRWGRGQETYGEDPYLTSRMGVEFVCGLQGNHPKYLKLVATPKHYAVHSGPELLRHGFDARIRRIVLAVRVCAASASPAAARDLMLPQVQGAAERFQVGTELRGQLGVLRQEGLEVPQRTRIRGIGSDGRL